MRSIPFRQCTALASLALLLLAGINAVADTSKISPDLQSLMSATSSGIDVVIQYSSPPQTCTASGFLGAIICTTVNLAGGILNTVFTLVNAVSATLTPSQILSTSDQSNVTYISPNRTIGATLDYSTAAVNASAGWNSGLNGTGIAVAVIDSGIYPHPDLNTAGGWLSRIVYRQSFTGGVQYDDFGHGTHVAGIIAGNGASSNLPGSTHVLRGVAPNANLVDLRVLDQNGSSKDALVIAAIQKAVALKQTYNVRVINLSLGRPIYETCAHDPLCQAVEAAWKQGIVVVSAAGNLGRNGYATILSPGNDPRVITVGAMKTMRTYPRSDDLIASYSSKGPTYIDQYVKPDIVAPGNLVVSLLAPGSTLANAFPGNIIAPAYYAASAGSTARYLRLSGTSMATPVVSGTVALLLQSDPTLTPDAIKARLMKTAGKAFPLFSTATDPTTGQTYTSTYDIFTVGAGYLDIGAALLNHDVVSQSAPSPSSAFNQATGTGNIVVNTSVVWGSSSAWSLATVWGNTVLTSPGTVIWNATPVWNTSTNWGTNVVWGTGGASGTNVVWGTGGTSATNVVWGTTGNGEN